MPSSEQAFLEHHHYIENTDFLNFQFQAIMFLFYLSFYHTYKLKFGLTVAWLVHERFPWILTQRNLTSSQRYIKKLKCYNPFFFLCPRKHALLLFILSHLQSFAVCIAI